MSFYIPSLQQFIALGKTVHFARKNRFVVNFDKPRGLVNYSNDDVKNIILLCEEAALQGKTLGTRTLRINALNEYRAQTADYMGDSITFQFLTDLNWTARKFFDAWLNLCVQDHNTRTVGYYDDYISTIRIASLTPFHPATEGEEGIQSEKAVWGMQLFEAFPRAINVQQVANTDEGYLRLNVTFSYKYWEPIDNTDIPVQSSARPDNTALPTFQIPNFNIFGF